MFFVFVWCFSMHTGANLFGADSEACDGDALLKNLWNHTDAILCCSLKTNVRDSKFFPWLNRISICQLVISLPFSLIWFGWNLVINRFLGELYAFSFLFLGLTGIHIRKPSWFRHAWNYARGTSRYNARQDSRWLWS